MKVLVLGLDGATWDILNPLISEGHLPNLARLRETGAAGSLDSIFPPLSPVAWTGVMTGKNSGKHGVFEFLEYGHDPLKARVNSSRSIQAELLWEIAGRHGKKTVAGGVPMSYPPRPVHDFPGFYLGDSCGKIKPFFPTRHRPTVDRSLVAKALNVSGFRRASPMAISRNACSLLDFPEFAQAVRYGVPGTPLRLSMYFLPSAIAIAVAPNSRSSAISSISLSMASLIRLPRE